MRSLLLSLSLLLPLFACASTESGGAPDEAMTPEKALKMEAVTVVEAWFEAAMSNDASGAAALGTKAWHQAELASPNSFTNGVVRREFTFESFSITGTELLEDGRAKVRARANLKRADGTIDGEGLRFTLERQADDAVLIVELD